MKWTIIEINAAQKQWKRAKTTLRKRKAALKELELELSKAEDNGEGIKIMGLRRRCAKKRQDIQESEGKIFAAEEIFYNDPWAPKKRLSDESQYRFQTD